MRTRILELWPEREEGHAITVFVRELPALLNTICDTSLVEDDFFRLWKELSDKPRRKTMEYKAPPEPVPLPASSSSAADVSAEQIVEIAPVPKYADVDPSLYYSMILCRDDETNDLKNELRQSKGSANYYMQKTEELREQLAVVEDEKK